MGRRQHRTFVVSRSEIDITFCDSYPLGHELGKEAYCEATEGARRAGCATNQWPAVSRQGSSQEGTEIQVRHWEIRRRGGQTRKGRLGRKSRCDRAAWPVPTRSAQFAWKKVTGRDWGEKSSRLAA